MWEKQHTTAVTENEDQAGMTLRVCSVKSDLLAEAELDLSSNQLRLRMASGGYEYQSPWLDVWPPLGQVAMDLRILEALERWLLLATLPYSKQSTPWPPLELTILLYKSIDCYLA